MVSSPPAVVGGIERRDLADSVADSIRLLILDQSLRVGQAVPPVTVMSQQLGVSRTIVREAVERLSDDGVISTDHGRRWRVKSLPVRPATGTARGGATAAGDVDHQSLADQVADAVLDYILSENLEANDTLPPGKDLADRFGVSIVVVREALASLSARGILSRRRGREPSVTMPEFRILSSILQVRAKLDRISLQEFQDCREVLEIESVRLAVEKAGPADHARLAVLISKMRAARNRAQLIEHDLEFHLEIARLSGNRAIELMFRTLNDVIRSQMLSSYTAVRRRAGRHGTERSLDIHEDVFNAIAAADTDAAVAAMREHFDLYDKLD